MKKTILFLLLLNFLIVFGQTPANDPTWELVWQDEFNSLNTNIWIVRNNFDHYGEKQVFIDDNVYTENGSLICKIKNETYYCPPYAVDSCCCRRQLTTGGQPYLYTSGWVQTKEAFYIQYGYIEAKINFPYHEALWPSFWTFKGNGDDATNNAEIDIAEMIGEKGPNVLPTNIHKGGNDGDINGQDLIPTNFSWEFGNWHKYAIEWSPSKIIWYLDGSIVRIQPNHGIIDPVKIILGNGVRPDGSFTSTHEMQIAYVKVYELKNDCSTVLNLCNYNFGTHDNKVKQNIVIGDGSCTNSLSVGQDIYLRASEGVLINGNFTVPVGAELYIDVNPCY